ncbi:MAG: hypothetical protein ABIR30_10885 [Chitinophagaceae bacterium]
MKKLFFTFPVLLVSFAGFAKNKKLADDPARSAVEGNMYFSNQPFGSSNSNSKTSFTSSEYIYGRVEIPSGTIKEAFKIKEDDRTYPYLQCEVTIFKGEKQVHSDKYYLLVKDEFKSSSTLDFDILPEGPKAITLYSLVNNFSAGLGHFPLSSGIGYAQLPDGQYKIRIKFFTETVNVYGSLQDEEKWPTLEGEFDFKFSEDDVPRIRENARIGSDLAEENAFRYDKMPWIFSNPGKLTDPNATTAKIAAILKRDLPQRQIIKWVAETYNGPYWHIATDDYGLPKYKYLNPHIWMAYKRGGKCYIGYVTLRQVYSGGGTYGPLAVAYTSTSEDKGIDCIKVK